MRRRRMGAVAGTFASIEIVNSSRSVRHLHHVTPIHRFADPADACTKSPQSTGGPKAGETVGGSNGSLS